MAVVSDLGKYLGIPLLSQRPAHRHFQSLLDKLATALGSWQSKFLSMAGRTVMIKSVLSSIPSYQLQVLSCPMHTAKVFDKISKNYLWGHDQYSRKWHGIKWDLISSPKNLGGL